MNFSCRFFFCSLFCFLLFSCASVYHKNDPSSYDYEPSKAQQAEDTLEKILASQNTLSSFKGIGSINISGNATAFSSRFAFMGTTSPHRLRLTILDIAGRPHETFAYNGKRIFAMSHAGDHPFINKKADDSILEKLISIPISPEEIAPVLYGNIPVLKYDAVFLFKADSPLQGLLLIHKKKVVEKIFYNNRNEIRKVEIFKKKNVYTVLFKNRQEFSSQNIPTVITIFSGSGDRCEFRIERYWPNVDNISPAIFTIATPK